jgi:predicted kinase
MTYCIIIRGPLGIGKSTIAKKLARQLGAKYISIDNVLAKHKLDKVGKHEKYIPARNFIKAQEIILPEVKENLSRGRKIIFDACFYHKGQIEHLIKNLQIKCYVFTLKATLQTCIGRDSKRKKTYGKDAATAVYKAVTKFNYGTIIDTEGKTSDDVVREIKSHIK